MLLCCKDGPRASPTCRVGTDPWDCPCTVGGSSLRGVRHTPGISYAMEGNTTTLLLPFSVAICKHKNPKAQGQAAGVSPCLPKAAGETRSSSWCRRFIQSQLHVKTKPSTKPSPELSDIPAQGS